MRRLVTFSGGNVKDGGTEKGSSDLVLSLFKLLLEGQSGGLLHGQLCRDGHQTLVGVNYVRSDLI